jgi:hypothetical protein
MQMEREPPDLKEKNVPMFNDARATIEARRFGALSGSSLR